MCLYTPQQYPIQEDHTTLKKNKSIFLTPVQSSYSYIASIHSISLGRRKKIIFIWQKGEILKHTYDKERLPFKWRVCSWWIPPIFGKNIFKVPTTCSPRNVPNIESCRTSTVIIPRHINQLNECRSYVTTSSMFLSNTCISINVIQFD
jgi:hypothetical protein